MVMAKILLPEKGNHHPEITDAVNPFTVHMLQSPNNSGLESELLNPKH